jgi:ADP-ribose pyrophosphatase
MNLPPELLQSLELPEMELEVLEDLSPPGVSGFLRVVRRRLRLRRNDGSWSEPFVYDEVERHALDAVVIAAHYLDGGVRHVYLRSAVRPPVTLRGRDRYDVPGSTGRLGLWELPAGLVEVHEQSEDGIVHTAKRELAEELGFDVPAQAFAPLGPSTFPACGAFGERHYFFMVEVNPRERRSPSLDGSVLESVGSICTVPLGAALQLCALGKLEDAKTELGLRRLAEVLER